MPQHCWCLGMLKGTHTITPSTIVHSLQIYSKLFKVVDKSEIVVPSNSGSINKDCGYCGNQRVGSWDGASVPSDLFSKKIHSYQASIW